MKDLKIATAFAALGLLMNCRSRCAARTELGSSYQCTSRAVVRAANVLAMTTCWMRATP